MNQKNPAVLGVYVSESSVEGVLIRKSADGAVHIVGRYVKQRSRNGERIADLAAVIPGLRESAASDYTMEIGDGSDRPDSDIFLAGELDALGVKKAENGQADSRRREYVPFGSQLQEILGECKSDGYQNLTLAFCLGSPDVSYHELGLPIPRERQAAVGSTREVGISKSRRKELVGKLEEATTTAFDKTTVGFLPMTDDQNRWRYFAVVPAKPNPVGEALDMVARRTRTSVPAVHIVDSEVSLLLSLVTRKPDAHQGRVGVVRVGSTDTTVMFLHNGRLDRYEVLRSLTSYDPVDTICSRVLLKQDELRIGEIDALYVATDHQGSNAVDTFRSFFPDSDVHALDELFDDHKLVHGEESGRLRTQTVPALAVALRHLEGWKDVNGTGSVINLFEKRRRGVRVRRSAPVRWHSYLAAAILFGVTLFYTWGYMSNQEVIDRREAEVALNPPEFPTESPEVLRARVDSLQASYARYSRALTVLDSLLIGSDMWSTTLERMTESTRAIGNIWLKAWTPDAGGLRVEGNALQRTRIARLAQQWDASIDKLTFAEIQGIRVYSFSMTVPLRAELPRVAQYLRENSLEELTPEQAEALAGMADAAMHSHSN